MLPLALGHSLSLKMQNFTQTLVWLIICLLNVRFCVMWSWITTFSMTHSHLWRLVDASIQGNLHL